MMKTIYIAKKEPKVSIQSVLICLMAFLLGCLATASVILHFQVDKALGDDQTLRTVPPPCISSTTSSSVRTLQKKVHVTLDSPFQVRTVLQSTKILVAIAAFDFSQIPHLEEVLDSYHDACVAGAPKVDVVIHATVAYPVTLIDLWNTRFNCEGFSIAVVLKPKSLRLHLVDCHRELFYSRLDDYDLFIYTEDDIRTTPTTMATYLYETKRLHHYLEQSTTKQKQYKPSDFNFGIVRYEYNYPANVVIDDKTRHATQNVTRVYWEHSGFERPVVPNAALNVVDDDTHLAENYFSMKNHHQGMFLATRSLLQAWKERCQFDVASNRPGKGSQPSEGTQRVWMSSQMLYGCRNGCCVKQILPKARSFGALTVLHLPNKNYRRVGKYRKRQFSDGTEVFEQPSATLVSALELHLGMRKVWPPAPQIPYRGITMVDEVTTKRDRSPMLNRRMREYQAYVDRGGVLSDYDMTKTDLVEDK